jgi:DNA repair protein RecN (Recombination protein N)
MLAELEIRNFALIEQLRLSFSEGLNVLTGETGAGKSIIMDALSSVLGGKTSPTSIRIGAEKAYIEAAFRPDSDVAAWLKHNELQDLDSGAELIVTKEITKTGSRSRVNGIVVNSAQLSELRGKLLAIHAQHEARTLMSRESQLLILDLLGDKTHKKLLEKVRTQYVQVRELTNELNALNISEEERLRRLDFTRFQLDELNEAQLSESDEDEQIIGERLILANAKLLEQKAFAAQEMLGEQEGCAIDLVNSALSEIEKASAIDAKLAPAAEAIKTACESIEDAARKLRHYRESIDCDEEKLALYDERLACLAQIKRKYGPNLIDAIALRDSLASELERLESSEANQKQMLAELKELEAALLETAEQLSAKRKLVAEKLSTDIVVSLHELGMPNCRFEISFLAQEADLPAEDADLPGQKVQHVGVSGLDRLEFQIAANPGLPPASIAKIASGGELSRVMLAIKAILSKADQVGTVVFDEIDTGLSGRALQAMRDKLALLAKSHQILCITHQPMIACVADNHIEVTKEQKSDHTEIFCTALNQNQRLKALAAMASGAEDQKAALAFAKSLFEEANFVKMRLN